jgi:hypothetical protein
MKNLSVYYSQFTAHYKLRAYELLLHILVYLFGNYAWNQCHGQLCSLGL